MAAGGSIARFGDGEIKATLGKHMVFQQWSEELAKGLKFVASFGGSPQEPPCLVVGTYPILDGNFSYFRKGARRRFAEAIYRIYTTGWQAIMPPGQYGDAFVSRPDCVDNSTFPAIDFFTPHWQRVFQGKSVLLVRGGTNGQPSVTDHTVFDRHFKLAKNVTQLKSFPDTDGTIFDLMNSASDIFDKYVGIRNEIFRQMEKGDYDVIVLSLGGTATILAGELSCRGFWALDVGQFGGNYSKKGDE